MLPHHATHGRLRVRRPQLPARPLRPILDINHSHILPLRILLPRLFHLLLHVLRTLGLRLQALEYRSRDRLRVRAGRPCCAVGDVEVSWDQRVGSAQCYILVWVWDDRLDVRRLSILGRLCLLRS